MADILPDEGELLKLLGSSLYDVWNSLHDLIESRYETDKLWNSGGKKWDYEYKYRRGGKTLCALYAKSGCVGFMVILGKDEREKFEAQRASFSEETLACYDQTHTYHDGKRLMLTPRDVSLNSDVEKLLLIKRRPNKKQAGAKA